MLRLALLKYQVLGLWPASEVQQAHYERLLGAAPAPDQVRCPAAPLRVLSWRVGGLVFGSPQAAVLPPPRLLTLLTCLPAPCPCSSWPNRSSTTAAAGGTAGTATVASASGRAAIVTAARRRRRGGRGLRRASLSRCG